jgi:DNA polymerase-3 subunit epsilon
VRSCAGSFVTARAVLSGLVTPLRLAHDLCLDKAEVVEIHRRYLDDLARAAWEDGVLIPAERHDIETVAALLGLDNQAVARALTSPSHPGPTEPASSSVCIGGLTPAPGNKVAFTVEIHQRSEIITEAQRAGLQVMNSVSRRTTVIAAANPDSLSGKAKYARAAGSPLSAPTPS